MCNTLLLVHEYVMLAHIVCQNVMSNGAMYSTG